MTETHLAFRIRRDQVREQIFIPKFYDPDLQAAVDSASAARFDVPLLGDLLLSGRNGSRLGTWIRREHYGTGDIPYVRTSDLAHWRIRPDYKKGIAPEIYETVRERQDVRAGDLLMVAHGSYLIGKVAMVTPEDGPVALQDHVFRLRVDPSCGVPSELLLAALSTAFVQRQVRSRQFSADIIDKIGDRHLGLRIPIPRSAETREEIVGRVRSILAEQTQIRALIREASQSDLRMTRERSEARLGFGVRRRQIADRILIPKFYDPVLESELQATASSSAVPWVRIGDLVASGGLTATTGIEVGKMAYGTGQIPFLRTSDLTEWEVKRDPKHSVSEAVFAANARRASVEPEDILVVRDGTYLVGSSAIVTSGDTPALICGGIYRIRVMDRDQVDPYALLAFLNLPIVRRQMRARQFTRDVIDTLGNRLLQVMLPSPSPKHAEKVGHHVAQLVSNKERVKRGIGEVIDLLEPPSPSRATGRPGWSMR